MNQTSFAPAGQAVKGYLLLYVEDAAGKEEEGGQEQFGWKSNVVIVIKHFLCPSLWSRIWPIDMLGLMGCACVSVIFLMSVILVRRNDFLCRKSVSWVLFNYGLSFEEIKDILKRLLITHLQHFLDAPNSFGEGGLCTWQDNS